MNTLLSVPEIATFTEDDELHVDLVNLAVMAGAPLTHEVLERLGLMVQRYVRQINPNARCTVHNRKRPS